MKINNSDFDNRLYELGLSKLSKKLTWADIADILFSEYSWHDFSSCITKDFCRKRYYKLLNKNGNCTDNKEIAETLLNDIKKERVKLSDEIVQNNAYIRQLAREETIKEIAKEYAEVMYKGKILNVDYEVRPMNVTKSAILQLSDWHYGLDVNNYWNSYSPEICIKRVNELQEKVKSLLINNNINKLYVINLSDLISGYIHLTLRLQNRYDVITQVMDVSEILAEFLNNISKYANIEYYDCLDNHSRLDPNKKDAINLESLTRITHWYLKDRLKFNNRIIIGDSDKYGGDIIEFYCNNHLVAGVHGDNDTMQNVVERISLMTGKKYDLILIAHNHYFAASEDTECIVVQNGSLMGTDFYATKLRKRSTPSQNFIIVSSDNVVDSIHRIVFNN